MNKSFFKNPTTQENCFVIWRIRLFRKKWIGSEFFNTSKKSLQSPYERWRNIERVVRGLTRKLKWPLMTKYSRIIFLLTNPYFHLRGFSCRPSHEWVMTRLDFRPTKCLWKNCHQIQNPMPYASFLLFLWKNKNKKKKEEEKNRKETKQNETKRITSWTWIHKLNMVNTTTKALLSVTSGTI